ncbi:hypothetical protein TNCV_565711 [Trichonephila clavipes]|nr:hypothetical protein TNCV_565711 [Trichonephila clavipes]
MARDAVFKNEMCVKLIRLSNVTSYTNFLYEIHTQPPDYWIPIHLRLLAARSGLAELCHHRPSAAFVRE